VLPNQKKRVLQNRPIHWHTLYIPFHYFKLPFLHYYFMVISSTVLIITIFLFASYITLQLCLISKAPKSDSECLCNSYVCTGQKSVVL
jgi:hypothetical protein